MPINSQAKGKRAERDLAKWWKVNGYPDAERAVKTGTTQTHDAGDLILEWNGFRICVEVKHHAGGLSDLQVASFGAKLSQQCVQSKSNMGVLVERRDQVSDVGRWWVHLDSWNLVAIMTDGDAGVPLRPVPHAAWRPVRVSVGYLAELLRRARLASPDAGVVSSAVSGSRRSGTAPVRAQAAGGS